MMDKAFDEIEQLLKDISEYLEKKSQNVKLSAEEQEYAQKLINRSKKQLETIDEFKSSNDYYVIDGNEKTKMESYVSMHPPGLHKENIDSKQLPPPLPAKSLKAEKNEIPPSGNTPEPTICPHKDLPAKQASSHIKCGHLITQKKFLKFPFNQKMFGVIHDNWLLIYLSEKDLKPSSTIDLRYYKANVDESVSSETEGDVKSSENSKHFGKKTATFRVLHTDMQSKKYEFVAQTEKDMRQWIAMINTTHDIAVRAANGIDEEIYAEWGDIFPPNKIDETPHLNTHYDRSMQSKPLPAIPTQEEDKKPNLPIRKQVPLIPTASTEDELYEELPFGDLEPAENSERVKSLHIPSSDSFDSIDERESIYDELAGPSTTDNNKGAISSARSECSSLEICLEPAKCTKPATPEQSEELYEDVTCLPDNVKTPIEPNSPIKDSPILPPKGFHITKNTAIDSLPEHENNEKITPLNNVIEKTNKPAFKSSVVNKSPVTPINWGKPKIPAKPDVVSPVNKWPLDTNQQTLKSARRNSRGNLPVKVDPTPKKSSSGPSTYNCCFETFSRNPKTFQSGTPKKKSQFETNMPDFNNCLKEINLLQSNKNEDNEQPLVLLKGEREGSIKKNLIKKNFIKPSVASNVPKKPVARKLTFLDETI